jgi:G-patch domain
MSWVQSNRWKKRARLRTSDPQNKHWANDKDKVSYKLMSSMGWREGQGLGTSSNGSTDVVSARVKFDNGGVGSGVAQNTVWSDANAAWGSMLRSLSSSSNGAAAKQKASDDSSVSESDESSDSDSCDEEVVEKKQRGLGRRDGKRKVTVSSHIVYSKRMASKSAAVYSREKVAEIFGSSARVNDDVALHSGLGAERPAAASASASNDDGRSGSYSDDDNDEQLSLKERYRKSVKRHFRRGSMLKPFEGEEDDNDSTVIPIPKCSGSDSDVVDRKRSRRKSKKQKKSKSKKSNKKRRRE